MMMTRVDFPAVNNKAAFDAIVGDYDRNDLYPPERELIFYLRDRITQMDILDLGVGTGRTTFTFAALARNYVGIDYASRMIASCRARFGESDRQRFLCLDAADLSNLSHQFDLILFTYNGIDYVSFHDRQRILDEVHRLLRPGGYFFFSCHSLDALPWRAQWPRVWLVHPYWSAAHLARQTIWNFRRHWLNRRNDLAQLKKRGWALLNDGAHNFALTTFYSTRIYQLGELADHGFSVECCFGRDGRRIGVDEIVSDSSIHFLCRKANL
jgi:SAM-dependent methyltransferase